MKRPLILMTLVGSILLLLAAGLYQLRARRASKIKNLQQRAETARSSENWGELEAALRQLKEYLPDEPDLVAAIGDCIIKGARTEEQSARALPFLLQAYRLEPSLSNQLVLAELQLASSPRESIRNAEQVLNKEPGNAAAERIQALAYVALSRTQRLDRHRLKATWKQLINVLEAQPSDMQAVEALTQLYESQAEELSSETTEEPGHLTQELELRWQNAIEFGEREFEARLLRVTSIQRLSGFAHLEPLLAEDIERLRELRPNSEIVRRLAAGQRIRHALKQRSSTNDDNQDLQLEPALEALMPTGSEAPANSLDLFWAGQINWMMREYQASLTALERAAEVSDCSLVQIRVAETAIALSQWGRAKRALDSLCTTEKASVPDGERALANLLLAQWYLAVGNPARSPYSAFEAVCGAERLAIGGGLKPLASHVKGLCYAAIKDWPAAEEQFRFASQLAAQPARARVGVAISLIRQGFYAEGRFALRRAAGELEKERAPFATWELEAEIARACLAEQRCKPEQRRRWEDMEESLAQLANQPDAQAVREVLLLEAYALGYGLPQGATLRDIEQQAVDKCGHSTNFWRMLGRYYLRRGRYVDAEEAVEALEDRTGRNELGLRLDLAEARKDYARALELVDVAQQPGEFCSDQALHIRKARILLAAGELEQAQALMESLVEQKPQDRLALNELASAAWLNQDFEQLKRTILLMEQCAPSAEIEVSYWRMQYYLGQFFRTPTSELGKQLNEAIGELNAVDQLPINYLVVLAQVEFSLGRLEDSFRNYSEAIARGTDEPYALLNYAKILHRRGESRKALDMLLRIQGGDERVYAAITICEILLSSEATPKQQDGIDKLLDELQSYEPKNRTLQAAFLSNLAALKEKHSDLISAVRLLRRAREIAPESIVVGNNLALYLAKQMEAASEALDIIEDVLASSPGNPVLMDTKGQIFLQQGKLEEALHWLESSAKCRATPSAAQLVLIAETCIELADWDRVRLYVQQIEDLPASSIEQATRIKLVRLQSKLNSQIGGQR